MARDFNKTMFLVLPSSPSTPFPTSSWINKTKFHSLKINLKERHNCHDIKVGSWVFHSALQAQKSAEELNLTHGFDSRIQIVISFIISPILFTPVLWFSEHHYTITKTQACHAPSNWPERDNVVETSNALFAVHGKVTVVQLVLGEDVHYEDLPTGSAQPHGAVHTTHGSDTRRTHWEGLQHTYTHTNIHKNWNYLLYKAAFTETVWYVIN